MITYLTTFEKQFDTSFTNEVVSATYSTIDTSYDTSTVSYGVTGSHVETYYTTQYGFYSSTSYTQSCDIAYSVSTDSYTSAGIVVPYGYVSFSVYETTTHNSPYPHSVYQETSWSAVYTTSSFETSSYQYSSYETEQSGDTLWKTDYTFISIYQDGSKTYYTSQTTESKIYSHTYSSVGTYNYYFSYINQGGTGFFSSYDIYTSSSSSINSYNGTRTPTQTTETHSTSYASSQDETFISGSSYSAIDSDISNSSTTSNSQWTFLGGGTGSNTIYYGPTTNCITSTCTWMFQYVYTNIPSSTTSVVNYSTVSGTFTLNGGSFVPTTTSFYSSDTVTTSKIVYTNSLSWVSDSLQSVTNMYPMDTAYVFERTATERMFSLSTTYYSFVEFSSLVKETTKYSAIPTYTTQPSSSQSSIYFNGYSTITTQSAITGTAFKVYQYSTGIPSFTVLETNGSKTSPFGAYGYPATSVTYDIGIYDITSRSVNNPSVTTNVTFQYTVSNYTVSEALINADKRIHPRMSIVANTTTSSTTVFSLLGVFGFGTTSLANP